VSARKYQIAAACAVTLLGALAAGMFGVYAAISQVRPFYAQALAVDPAVLKAGGQELESRASVLYSDSRRPGQWQAVFTADEINGWLATQLVEGGAHALPKGIGAPRVAIGKDAFTFGFRARRAGLDTVVSADASVAMTESGAIAIRLKSVQAGMVPLPVLGVADEVSKACQALKLPVRWMQENGEPVALVDVREQGFSKAQLTIDAVELRDGALYVAGHTEKGDAQMARKASNIAE
jgi:hypothetical protein